MLYELSAGLPMSEWAELWAELRMGIRAWVYTSVYAILYIDREILAQNIDFNNFKI